MNLIKSNLIVVNGMEYVCSPLARIGLEKAGEQTSLVVREWVTRVAPINHRSSSPLGLVARPDEASFPQ